MKERKQWKRDVLLRKNTMLGKKIFASEKCFKRGFLMVGLMIGKPRGIYDI